MIKTREKKQRTTEENLRKGINLVVSAYRTLYYCETCNMVDDYRHDVEECDKHSFKIRNSVDVQKIGRMQNK